MKFNTRLTILILEMAIIPIVLGGLVVSSITRDVLRQSVFTELDAIAQIQKNRLYGVLSSKEDFLLVFLSRSKLRSDLQNYNKHPSPEFLKSISGIIADTKAGSDIIQKIVIADTKGYVIASTDETVLGTNISNEKYFISGISRNDVSILEKDPVTKKVIEHLAGPLVLDGEVLGMVNIDIDAHDVSSVASDYTGLGKTGETQIVIDDGSGNSLFVTPLRFDPNAAFARVVTKERTNTPAVHAINGKEMILEDSVDYRNVPVYAATRYLPEAGWGVVVKIDKEEALLPAVKEEKLFFFLFALAILIIIFVGISVSRSVTQPIQYLIARTKKIIGGDFGESIPLMSRDEFGELSQSFNTMIANIVEARRNVDLKVEQQTASLREKDKVLEDQKKALSNILADTESRANDLAKFKLAVDNASDHIVITDPEGLVLYGNRMVERITGFSLEEALGKKAGTLWHTPMSKEYYQEMWRVIKTEKKPFRGQLQNIRKNGEPYEADVSISPVLDQSGNVIFFVGIERDITREKQIDRAKTEFVSLASHQLRTPLSSINWYTEMLLGGDAGAVNEEQARFLKEVYASSQRMVALINALLNVSRIELGTLSVEPEPTNLNDVSRSVLAELRPMIEKRKQHIEENYDANLPIIPADTKMIRVIFQNLLSNAIKYSPEGGTVGVKTAVSSDKKDMQIEIYDNGLGIPKEQQDQVFVKFFRADNAREVDTDGTGLGLYMIKMIVEQIGGNIKFTSELNKGTTFHVSFPIEGMAVKRAGKSLTIV